MKPTIVHKDEVVRTLRNLSYIFKALKGLKQRNNILIFYFQKIYLGTLWKMALGVGVEK